MPDLTDHEIELLKAVGKGLNAMSDAESIAARLGYRPARSGVLAVTSRLRAVMRKYSKNHDKFSHECQWLVRLTPRDQWACATWCLTPEARKLYQAKRA